MYLYLFVTDIYSFVHSIFLSFMKLFDRAGNIFIFFDSRSWKLEMLDFNGQLSLAAGGVAFETLTNLTEEGSKQLMYMSAVSHQIKNQTSF